MEILFFIISWMLYICCEQFHVIDLPFILFESSLKAASFSGEGCNSQVINATFIYCGS